jgi:predicted dehydrogenase
MHLLTLLILLSLPLAAAEHTIAVVGLVHSHVWGHLGKMVAGKPAQLVGVAETEPELIDNAKKRGVPDNLIHSDWKKMIDEKKPEIVWAFVENNRHKEIVEYCAPRKIHIMFEKPLASTHKDAVAIRTLARKHGIYVLSNYQMAWWASNYTAKDVIDSGKLGKVWRVRGVVGHGGPGNSTGLNKYFFNWLTDPVKNGGGAMVDFGCYNALWSLWILGRPTSVFAHTAQLRPGEFPKVEDTSAIMLTYPQGVAMLEGSWDLPRSFQDLEVFGLNGSVHAVNGRVEYRSKNQRGPGQEVPLKPLAPEDAEPIANMIAAIENKKEPSGLVAIDINVDVMEIIDAAKESVKTGKPVKLASR